MLQDRLEEGVLQVAQGNPAPDVHPPRLERHQDQVAHHESTLCRHRHLLSRDCGGMSANEDTSFRQNRSHDIWKDC